ncbi:MAG: T9SS type A sorting domain-containing protein [Bacteroidetes bacterium]|nr:T9SS type A sorting domain-containing protein [Bacteroidota bacterium]
MKHLIHCLLLFVISSFCFSQEVSILNNIEGQPSSVILKLSDTTYIHPVKDGEIPEHISFDGRYNISPKYHFERNPTHGSDFLDMHMDSIEPGILPEADLPYKVKYTSDGSRIVIIYHHSNNVVVYDAEDLSILADIKIGEGPEDLFVNEDRIYVSCYYSDDIYIISLDDYSIEDHFFVDPQPSVIEVNQSEDIIYIGFDMREHWKLADLAAFGLSTHKKLWENSWPFIEQINMWEGWIGRKVYTLSRFELIGSDRYIASLRNGGMLAIILDAFTGEVVKTFYRPGEGVVNFKASQTGDTLFMQSRKQDSIIFYRVDAYTHKVLDSVITPKESMIGFWYWQDNLAVNKDGSKMFLEIGNIATGQYGVMADFDSHVVKLIPLEQYDDAQIDMVQSYDKRYTITMGDKYRIFDFELEDYVYNEYLTLFGNYKVMASSPVSYDFIWCDFLANKDITNWKKNETINVFNFDDPANLVKTDSAICGVQPEADLTYSAVLNNTHEKIITANPLSGNISIINANTYEVDTLLDIEEISTIVQVNDDHLLMGGSDIRQLLLFDIPTLSIIKQFNANGFDMIMPGPYQEYAYAYSRKEHQLIKIRLDGANSVIEQKLDITDYFAYYVTWEYTYSPEISPDGKYIIIGQQYTALVIDTELMEVVANVTLSGRCIHDMAFTEDSKRVCIPFWFLTPTFDIVYLDGSGSYLENTISADDGYGGMSVEFNRIDKKFYIARRDDIWVVDPETAIIEDTIDFEPVDPQVQICIDPQGKPIVNTMRYLYHDGVEYHMKEPTRSMYVDYASQKCIIPSPGPDRVYILDFLTTTMHEIPVTKSSKEVSIFPNPASDQLTIESGKPFQRIEIYNASGQLLFGKDYRNTITTLNVGDYSPGIYIVRVGLGDESVARKVVIEK